MELHVTFLAAFGAGMLTFLSPCILPLVPAYLSFISGRSWAELSKESDDLPFQQSTVVISSLFFVFGLSAVFMIMGAGATALGQLFAQHRIMFYQVSGLLMILFGLHYLGLFKIPFLNFEKRIHLHSKPAGWIGAFILGLAFGFGWTPCVGPVLSSILMIATTMGEVQDGLILLGIFSAGLGVPFLICAALSARFMVFLSRFNKNLGTVEKITGLLLILSGLLVMSGTLRDLTARMLELFPALNNLN